MHYYLQTGTKNIWFTDVLIRDLPEHLTYLGHHSHPNPKMAVVSFMGRNATGFNIREVIDVSLLLVSPSLARRVTPKPLTE